MTRAVVGIGFGLAVSILPVAAPVAAPLTAQGHGPVYGLSTPTLGRGGWSLDVAGMGRFFDGGQTAMLRPMLSYGVTEDLQLSASLPLPVARDDDAPAVRAFIRMPASQDAEIMVGWRVQRRGTGVGTRQETTLWFAVDVPTDARRDGLETAPGLFGSVVTGYASRAVYVWLGGAYRRSLSAGSDQHRAGDVTMGSLVVGYRPPSFRADYPHPDWRMFVEVVGERVGRDSVGGIRRSDSGGRQLYVALTLLGLYGSWGLAGGPAFPLYQSLNGNQRDDGVRLAVNASFWF
ncbi:MAG: hypothetical protein IIB36_03985 [Gemmatimonadetes bacterium]|nr:hypothetical protein [Gemmatimonadota bacterium]